MMQTTDEARRDRRTRLESDEPGITVQPGANILWFYALCTAVPFVAAVLCFTVAPDGLLVVGVIASIATVVAAAPLVMMLLHLQRSRTHLARISRTAETVSITDLHAVHFGFNRQGETELSHWDGGPIREGALGVTQAAVFLFGPDGSSVSLPFADLLGAVLDSRPGRAPSVDLHLRSGGAVEVRALPYRSRALAVALSRAGVRLVEDRED
jgi:hypothetical protein